MKKMIKVHKTRRKRAKQGFDETRKSSVLDELQAKSGQSDKRTVKCLKSINPYQGQGQDHGQYLQTKTTITSATILPSSSILTKIMIKIRISSTAWTVQMDTSDTLLLQEDV